MGNSISQENFENVEKENKQSIQDITEKINTIAANYIVNLSIPDMESLLNEESCNKVEAITRDVFLEQVKMQEVEVLNQKTVLGEKINSTTRNDLAVVFHNKKLKNKEKFRKRQYCNSVAKFYIKIAHLYAAIVKTIDPQFDVDGGRINDLFKVYDLENKDYNDNKEYDIVEKTPNEEPMGHCYQRVRSLIKLLPEYKKIESMQKLGGNNINNFLSNPPFFANANEENKKKTESMDVEKQNEPLENDNNMDIEKPNEPLENDNNMDIEKPNEPLENENKMDIDIQNESLKEDENKMDIDIQNESLKEDENNMDIDIQNESLKEDENNMDVEENKPKLQIGEEITNNNIEIQEIPKEPAVNPEPAPIISPSMLSIPFIGKQEESKEMDKTITKTNMELCSPGEYLPDFSALDKLFNDKFDYDIRGKSEEGSGKKTEYKPKYVKSEESMELKKEVLAKFYKSFSGENWDKSSKGKELDSFRDIKLKDFSYLCKDKPISIEDNEITNEIERKLLGYARFISEMITNVKIKYDKLVDVLTERIFIFNDGNIMIDPNLNDFKYNDELKNKSNNSNEKKYNLTFIVENVREIIVDLYSECETDFQKGIEKFEEIKKLLKENKNL